MQRAFLEKADLFFAVCSFFLDLDGYFESEHYCLGLVNKAAHNTFTRSEASGPFWNKRVDWKLEALQDDLKDHAERFCNSRVWRAMARPVGAAVWGPFNLPLHRRDDLDMRLQLVEGWAQEAKEEAKGNLKPIHFLELCKEFRNEPINATNYLCAAIDRVFPEALEEETNSDGERVSDMDEEAD